MPSKLSFEINLDEDSVMSDLTMKAYNMVKKSRKNEKKTETKKPDKQVRPKKFINHILELGFEA